MLAGWHELGAAETLEHWELEKPVVAMWAGPGDANVCLYEDGLIEVEGHLPVELLPFLSAAWHGFQRGKVAG